MPTKYTEQREEKGRGVEYGDASPGNREAVPSNNLNSEGEAKDRM
jgi:uncharacterized NAD(P)/FAD-binding protein YdhS